MIFLRKSQSGKSIQIIEFLGKNADWESWSKKFFHAVNARDIKIIGK